MKQVLYSLRNGNVSVSEVPPPVVRPNGILVRTSASLISPGTERASLEFGRMPLIAKARSRPDLLKQVLDKARRDGFLEAARVAVGRLGRPVPAGYACAGEVLAIGSQASEFRPGDAVACAGAGYASHADVNYVPRNLAVPIPRRADGRLLAFGEASFATLGAIALHGIRLGHPGLGERAVVIGLGVIGLIAGQILRAHGCVVLGVDLSQERCARAIALGFDDAVVPDDAIDQIRSLSRGLGADLILITASSAGSEPVQLAGELARDRAAVVAIGATGLEIPRRLYYGKELSLVVARSYGPGRYDPNFEERGQDYPPGYVRWTERENMRAFLELVANNRVSVEPLITHRINIEKAEGAYALLDDPAALGIVLEYPHSEGTSAIPSLSPERIALKSHTSTIPGSIGVSVLGAGSFAQDVLLPLLKRTEHVHLRGVVTAGGLSAKRSGELFGFDFCASAPETIWQDPDTLAVMIATRHHLHGPLVCEALAAGKAIFVEKPLCIAEEELSDLILAYRRAQLTNKPPLVTVGFNRRFAPLATTVRRWCQTVPRPLSLSYRINAGPLPKDSWVADPEVGGGRIVSEMCHFVDLATFLIGASVVTVHAQSSTASDDVAVILTYADESLATLSFCSGGDRSFSKERIEVFGGGGVAIIDDFRRGWIVRGGRRSRISGWTSRQRKGHREEIEAFVKAVRDHAVNPVPFDEAVAVTRATFAIRESLSRGVPVDIGV